MPRKPSANPLPRTVEAAAVDRLLADAFLGARDRSEALQEAVEHVFGRWTAMGHGRNVQVVRMAMEDLQDGQGSGVAALAPGYVFVPREDWDALLETYSVTEEPPTAQVLVRWIADDKERLVRQASSIEELMAERNEIRTAIESVIDVDADGLSIAVERLVDRYEQRSRRNGELEEEIRGMLEVTSDSMHEAAASDDELEIHKRVIKAKDAEIERLNRELDAMGQRALAPTFGEPDASWPDRIEAALISAGAERMDIPPLAPGPIQIEDFEPVPSSTDGPVEPLGTELARQQATPPKTVRYESPPCVMHANQAVPESFPGRDKEPQRVTLQDPAPKVPTLDDRVEAIRRIAEGESKADIASFLGLKSANVVVGMTMTDKRRIDRVRQAAPHDRQPVLDDIRAELLAQKEGGNAR